MINVKLVVALLWLSAGTCTAKDNKKEWGFWKWSGPLVRSTEEEKPDEKQPQFLRGLSFFTGTEEVANDEVTLIESVQCEPNHANAVQFVETFGDIHAGNAACAAEADPDSCGGGCCRFGAFFICDEANKMAHLPCVCNRNTQNPDDYTVTFTEPSAERSGETTSDAVEDSAPSPVAVITVAPTAAPTAEEPPTAEGDKSLHSVLAWLGFDDDKDEETADDPNSTAVENVTSASGEQEVEIEGNETEIDVDDSEDDKPGGGFDFWQMLGMGDDKPGADADDKPGNNAGGKRPEEAEERSGDETETDAAPSGNETAEESDFFADISDAVSDLFAGGEDSPGNGTTPDKPGNGTAPDKPGKETTSGSKGKGNATTPDSKGKGNETSSDSKGKGKKTTPDSKGNETKPEESEGLPFISDVTDAVTGLFEWSGNVTDDESEDESDIDVDASSADERSGINETELAETFVPVRDGENETRRDGENETRTDGDTFNGDRAGNETERGGGNETTPEERCGDERCGHTRSGNVNDADAESGNETDIDVDASSADERSGIDEWKLAGTFVPVRDGENETRRDGENETRRDGDTFNGDRAGNETDKGGPNMWNSFTGVTKKISDGVVSGSDTVRDTVSDASSTVMTGASNVGDAITGNRGGNSTDDASSGNEIDAEEEEEEELEELEAELENMEAKVEEVLDDIETDDAA